MLHRSLAALLTVVSLLGLLFTVSSTVAATSVDRLALCNLEGYPGDVVEEQITLSGTDSSERSGYWYTLYKELDGDSERMDITSWIEITPEDYTLNEGETTVTSIRVSIPEDAEPGLWGAISESAGEAGQSDERRTYVVFKDTITGGNVYSGLLIPVSVYVLGKPSPLTLMVDFVSENAVEAVLIVAVVILAALLVRKGRRARRVS